MRHWVAAAVLMSAGCQAEAQNGTTVAQNAALNTADHGARGATVYHGKGNAPVPPPVAVAAPPPPPPPPHAGAGVILLELAESSRPVRFHTVALRQPAAAFLTNPRAAFARDAAGLRTCLDGNGGRADGPVLRTTFGGAHALYRVPVQNGTLLFQRRRSGADVCEVVSAE